MHATIVLLTLEKKRSEKSAVILFPVKIYRHIPIMTSSVIMKFLTQHRTYDTKKRNFRSPSTAERARLKPT